MPRVVVVLVEAGGRERRPVLLVAVAHGIHGVHPALTLVHHTSTQA